MKKIINAAVNAVVYVMFSEEPVWGVIRIFLVISLLGLILKFST